MYTIRDSAACGPPNRVATRSTWDRPIKPQFKAPTITRTSVAMLITLIDRLRCLRMELSGGGFEICIDGLFFWRMRIGREIGCGTSMQALRERRACQERADAHQAALPVQSLRPELHRHTHPGQTAGPEGGGRAALRQRPVDEPHRPAPGCLDPHHPGLAGAVRGRLRPEARAGRTSGGDRAR